VTTARNLIYIDVTTRIALGHCQDDTGISHPSRLAKKSPSNPPHLRTAAHLCVHDTLWETRLYADIHCPGSIHCSGGPDNDPRWQTNSFKPPLIRGSAQVATTIDGKAMSTPVFIIGDSFTATSEQEATLDGTPTVLGVYLFGSYGHSGGDG
jgi:hypothetical protein